MAQFSATSLIKKPYRKLSYTPHQLKEFALCADPISGPLYFMENYFWVQHPIKGKIQYQPYSYQKKMITAFNEFRNVSTLLPRQAGKTITAAGFLLWFAMFNSDQTILIAAHKFSGSKEIMSRIRFGFESCDDFIRAGVTEYNKQSIIFDNGSTISAETTTENTGRGKSISLLYCLGGENTVTVRDKNTGKIKNITLQDLYKELEND